ncbi:YkgJ family cysteine cluster protein [Campylobacter lari]|uniref:YkgJ family cysteine cluster protein n=1 Tax=Campylobacter sp. IFREMER_LSEM_CL1097 TaxID=2911613 RepID=UPI00191BD005|nr:YkgJ family cysteine cluster protein [Campylobacter sp. IFREMER_LSEM_CL1097]HEC1764136.1 YkgJ family cysteine cluster protein [Campylobacter lari]HEC1785346.1 YkgJ family cysteine cluster protein [Campylobacter lari]
MILKHNFPCTSCGACCKNINGIEELKHFNINGVCINLQEDNSCKIYNERPLVCRVEDFYNKYFKDTMSKKDFYNENIKICNLLQDKLKLDKKYKINLITKEI